MPLRGTGCALVEDAFLWSAVGWFESPEKKSWKPAKSLLLHKLPKKKSVLSG
jgi:hypothetical protein